MSYSVIIPSRNETNLRACVSAIRAAGETCRIIVVWDGDDIEFPGPAIAGIAEAPGVQVYRGYKPFVFSKNMNLGILRAGEDDAILLNDDALLKTAMGFAGLEWQTNYVNMKTHDPIFGIVSPVTNNIGNPLQVGKLQKMTGSLKIEPRTLAFVCVYIPRSTINTVGLMDETFGGLDDRGKEIYGFCDNDYCLRVRNAGLKLGVYDGCFLDHNTLPSQFRSQGPRSLEPGMRHFIKKWGTDSDGNPREKSSWSHLFQ